MQIITAATLSTMFSLMAKDPFFDQVLVKYFSRKDERNEFRQQLHLIICEMQDKAIQLWNAGSFKWYFLGIISNQVKSNTSAWHKDRRDYNLLPIEDFELPDDSTTEDTKEYKLEIERKIDLVNNIIAANIKENPILKRDFYLFNLYYLEEKTYREISALTQIPTQSCWLYVKNARDIIIQGTKNQN